MRRAVRQLALRSPPQSGVQVGQVVERRVFSPRDAGEGRAVREALMRSVLVNQESNCGSMAPMTVRMLTSWAGTLLLMIGSRWAARFRRW